MLLNDKWINKIRKKPKSMKPNENEPTATQNLWDTVKAVLRGKFIAIQAYLKKTKNSQETT